jgi:hypothetical protein
VNLLKATYQVTLRAANNGDVIASATLAGQDTTCPSEVGALPNKVVCSWHAVRGGGPCGGDDGDHASPRSYILIEPVHILVRIPR